MILSSLKLTNFKLHLQSGLDFSEKLNYIVGGNGQGKTTILEAIYYLCTTKGFGQTNDLDAVNFGHDLFDINGTFQDSTERQVRVYFHKTDRKKKIFLDGKQIFRPAEFIGNFPVVTLTLSDHEITSGAPADRRKFVDSIISQASSAYLKILLEYNKTLKHRSSLLQRIKEDRSGFAESELDAWDETLVKLGSQIIKHRMAFALEFNFYVGKAYKRIMHEVETPALEYVGFAGDLNPENLEERFMTELKKLRPLEIVRTKNLLGPHRDGFSFFLNKKLLKKFGSQGQHKTFQIALRFAQFFYIKDKSGKTPVFLMDDIFGELDSYRSGKIRDFLDEVGQAFITMTDFTKYENLHKFDSSKLIMVENGTVSYA